MQRSGTTRTQTPRVGFVLGGGGILGGAWLVGALHALQQSTGFDPTTADYIVGTSAGSVVGALTAEGIPPWFLVYQQRGGTVEGMTDRFGEPLAGRRRGLARLHHLDGRDPAPRPRLPAARAPHDVAAPGATHR